LASQAGDKYSGGSASISGSLSTSNLAGSITGMSSAPGPQPSKIGSNFKFVRIPCLQRVTKVCANSSGAFGALKVDYRHAPIQIEGNGIAEDLKEVMPFVVMYGDGEWKRTMKGGRYALGLKRGEDRTISEPSSLQPTDPDDEDIDTDEVKEDVLRLRHLCEIVDQEKKGRKDYPKDRRLPFDADVMVFSQSEAAFPAHRVILAARSHVLCSVLNGEMVANEEKANVSTRFVPSKGKHPAAPRPFPSISTCGKLMISGCHTLTILVFLTYLYSDELLAVWDPRVKAQLQKECLQLKVKPDQVKAELQALARTLDLPLLSEALELSIKRVPMPSVARDIGKLWLDTQLFEDWESPFVRGSKSPLAPDVLLQLADRDVWCHSLLLRTRLDLFSSFFGEEDWIVNRRNDNGVVKLNFRHLKWNAMQYVLRFVFCGEEEELFERLGELARCFQRYAV
jgi:inhibitor of Bruton tyrosine kinase